MFDLKSENLGNAKALELQIESNKWLANEGRLLKDKMFDMGKEMDKCYQTIKDQKGRNVALGNTKKSMDQKISRLEKENEDFKEESFRYEETLCTIEFICKDGTFIDEDTHVKMVQALHDNYRQQSVKLIRVSKVRDILRKESSRARAEKKEILRLLPDKQRELYNKWIKDRKNGERRKSK